MKTSRYILLGLVILLPSDALSEDNLVEFHPWTLRDTLKIYVHDAILMGLQNHPSIAMQILAPEIAKTYVNEQGAAFEPIASGDFSNGENKTQRRLGTQPEPVDLVDKQKSQALELSGYLPTGTDYALSISKAGSTSSLYTDQNTANIGLTITQSLLKGLGFGANLAALRKAKLDMEMSDAEFKGVAQDFIARVERSYWELYLAEQEVNIQTKSLELANQQLYESNERVNVGKLAPLEVTVVEAEVASRKVALINAQSHYEQARLQFIYLINLGNKNSWEFYPMLMDEPFIPKDRLDDIETHSKVALKNSPELIQSRLALSKGDLEVRNTRNGLLPELDLFISLGRTSYAASFDKAQPDPNSDYYQNSAGLSFSFPVTNLAARAKYQRAQLSKEQLKLAVANMEKLVQLDVRLSYIEVMRTRQQITATSQTRALQELKLDAELEKFRVGKSTNFAVLQAQRDYTSSQIDEARTKVSYLEALIDLYVKEGSLVERRQLKIFE